MAIAHRDTQSATATLTTDDGVTITKPTGTANGDVLLAWVATADDKAITPPAGWTELQTFAGNGNTIWFGFKVASGEGASYAFTWTDSRGLGIISAFSGVDTSDPIWAWRAHDISGNGVHTIEALSPVATDPATAMLVTFMTWNRGSVTSTVPSGYTLPTNGNPDSGGTTAAGVEGGVAYKAYTGGSGIAASQWNGSSNTNQGTNVHIALRPSGAGSSIAAWPSAAYHSASSSTTHTLNMPTYHRAGDVLVAHVAWRGDSISASMSGSGWTQKGSTITEVSGSADFNVATFYKIATSSAESGTVTFSSAVQEVAASVLAVRVTGGSSGNPWADYQTVTDATANTTADVPANTVPAQEMLVIAAVEKRGDAAVTAAPTGYAQWSAPSFADANLQTTFFVRSGTASGNIMLGVAVLFQTTANPAATSFTVSGALTSLGIQGTIGIAAATAKGRSFAVIIG